MIDIFFIHNFLVAGIPKLSAEKNIIFTPRLGYQGPWVGSFFDEWEPNRQTAMNPVALTKEANRMVEVRSIESKI